MFTSQNKKKYNMILIVLAVVLLLLIIISFALGRYPVSPSELLGIIYAAIMEKLGAVIPFFENISNSIEPFWDSTQELIVFNIRFPRIIMACIVGSALSAAGASYQGVFQNPMASPDILGASSGAAFGASLAFLLDKSMASVTLYAFISSMVCVLLVIFVSEFTKGKKVIGLVLSGIMISSLFTSGTSFIKLVADPTDQLPAITYWLMGSLSGAKLSDLKFLLVPFAIGVIPLIVMRWKINILTLGDDEAKTMGINAKVIRMVVIICATLITAASVSVSGLIGWVGLVVPHIARRLVGNNYYYLMPASIIVGALFLLIVDNISRNLLATEIPIGILTSFVGAPFFIYLITRRERF